MHFIKIIKGQGTSSSLHNRAKYKTEMFSEIAPLSDQSFYFDNTNGSKEKIESVTSNAQ